MNKRIAIMQPYFFPYLGYFALLKKTECFVIADDLNFIKGGYINRNYILGSEEKMRMTLQLKKASQNKLINEIERGDNTSELLEMIEYIYKKAPYFSEVYPLIQKILAYEETNLARFLGQALEEIQLYLGLQCKLVYSSEIDKDETLRFDKRIFHICKTLGYDHYVNAPGGKELYDKAIFASEGLELSFIECEFEAYEQFGKPFTPSLSIIDVMMFNSVDRIHQELDRCILV